MRFALEVDLDVDWEANDPAMVGMRGRSRTLRFLAHRRRGSSDRTTFGDAGRRCAGQRLTADFETRRPIRRQLDELTSEALDLCVQEFDLVLRLRLLIEHKRLRASGRCLRFGELRADRRFVRTRLCLASFALLQPLTVHPPFLPPARPRAEPSR